MKYKKIGGLDIKQIKTHRAIREVISGCYHIPINLIGQKTRKREVKLCRQLEAYFLKKYTKYSWGAISELIIRGQDHATAIHSKETIEDLMFKNFDFRQTVSSIDKVILDKINELKADENQDKNRELTLNESLDSDVFSIINGCLI